MPAYLRKSTSDILREALKKLQEQTPITAISPGSVARAIVEAVVTEHGDMYEIIDFNMNQMLVTSATGSALDLIGSIYNVSRKTVNTLAAIEAGTGVFYFYLTAPSVSDITIPKGTNVYTSATSFVGQRFSYSTTESTTIVAGRTRAYAGIKPNFTDSVYTAGTDTLVLHDAISPQGITILCTNPKPITTNPAYEADEAFRARIIKSIRVAATGTAEAVRFAGLSVPGIRDIKIRQAAYGMGSFEAVIVPENGSQGTQAANVASLAMDAAKPLGTRMLTVLPTPLEVSVRASIIVPTISTPVITDAIIGRTTLAVQRYVNSLLPGEAIVYNQLLKKIFDSSEFIKDVIIKNFTVDGVEVLRRNYQPKANEQLVPGGITIEAAAS